MCVVRARTSLSVRSRVGGTKKLRRWQLRLGWGAKTLTKLPTAQPRLAESLADISDNHALSLLSILCFSARWLMRPHTQASYIAYFAAYHFLAACLYYACNKGLEQGARYKIILLRAKWYTRECALCLLLSFLPARVRAGEFLRRNAPFFVPFEKFAV